MSSRRSVPVGVQVITGVGGFAAGLITLSAVLLLGLSIREGEFGLAVQVLPMLVLGIGHIVSLYGLVTLRRWGYKWTRRLFALTLLIHLPAVQAGNPLQVGTLLFSGVVVGYLWLLRDTSVFTAAPTNADDPAAGGPGDGPVEVDPLDDDGDGPTTIDVDPLDGASDTDRDRSHDGDHGHDGDRDDPATGDTGADDEPDAGADGDDSGDGDAVRD